MLIPTRLLRADEIDRYSSFLDECTDALIYHTPNYFNFLTGLIPNGHLLLLVAEHDSHIVGALPLVAVDGPHGRVLNSLPYFGSHGDFLISSAVEPKGKVADQLCLALARLLDEGDFSAVNVVAHPFFSWIGERACQVGLEAWDERISQTTELKPATDRESALNQVLQTCHQKSRNLVRKGLKSGFSIEVEDTESAWSAMIEHHRVGMLRIGGKFKSQGEFDGLRSAMGRDCRLFVARKNGVFAGALLNLYFREWVEYFTPVAVEEYRNDQVLSAIIACSMCDAILEGRRFWNWGGTWSSQAGVYHFKKGWGAVDRRYTYWGKLLTRGVGLLDIPPTELTAAYPSFYVRPFNQAKG